jgi:hypothetical protein
VLSEQVKIEETLFDVEVRLSDTRERALRGESALDDVEWCERRLAELHEELERR